MDVLMEWVRNLAVCMILIAAAVRILPKNHFEKYIRFYTGLLVLILVIRPFLELFSLDTSLFRSFQSYMDRMGDSALEEQMKEAEESRKTSITGQLEEQAAGQITKQIDSLVRQEGLEVTDCQVTFNMDETSEDYGQIQSVAITLAETREEGTVEAPVVISGNQIQVWVGEADGSEEASQETSKREKREAEKRQLMETVREEAADMISADPEQVSVSLAG